MQSSDSMPRNERQTQRRYRGGVGALGSLSRIFVSRPKILDSLESSRFYFLVLTTVGIVRFGDLP
jgi:hypothetical protein